LAVTISKVMKKFLSSTLLICAICTSVSAATITFVPPNDTSGAISSTNSNDGYSTGRGILFTVDSATTVDSVGIYQDLTNVSLSFDLEIFNGTNLANGGSTVSTTGLEWIDYGGFEVNLSPGNTYHLEFTFTGNSNQNFFYNNFNVTWSQDGFSALDGTRTNFASNSVVAAFRMNAVPDTGSTAALLGAGVAALAFARRRLG